MSTYSFTTLSGPTGPTGIQGQTGASLTGPTGPISLNASSNITVGTVTCSSISASGIVTSSSGLSGSLLTASQPNITAVGTLSSLSVTGDVSVSGNVNLTSAIVGPTTLPTYTSSMVGYSYVYPRSATATLTSSVWTNVNTSPISLPVGVWLLDAYAFVQSSSGSNSTYSYYVLGFGQPTPGFTQATTAFKQRSEQTSVLIGLAGSIIPFSQVLVVTSALSNVYAQIFMTYSGSSMNINILSMAQVTRIA